MNPKKKDQISGLHQGPYAVGRKTQADVTVTAAGSECDPVVVGRFPYTREIDASAQAQAYSALPDLIRSIRELLYLATVPENERIAIAERAIAALEKAGAR